MHKLAAFVLLIALTSTVSANTFKLECLDAYDSKRRLALLEINTDTVTVRVYSESEREWKAAVNVAITDATFSFVEHEFGDLASAGTSVTIDRASGKYFSYTAHAARKDGRCKKVE
jgi:predicted secreted protein